jgi:hypothetical protein
VNTLNFDGDLKLTCRKTPNHRAGWPWYLLSLAFITIQGCASSPDNPRESTAVSTGPVVHIPVTEASANPAGIAQQKFDAGIYETPELKYNRNAEVYEEEKRVPGEDANFGIPPLTGYSWLRSYAQQATVVFVLTENIDCCHVPGDNDTWDPSLTDKTTSNIVTINPDDDGSNGNHTPGATFKDFYNLDKNEPWQTQRSVGFCTGTLIDDDLILTAGHCIRRAGQKVKDGNGVPQYSFGAITDVRVVFNYFNRSAGEGPKVSLTKDVFRVREVMWINQKNPPVSAPLDFALLQLVGDDNVTPRSARPRFQPVPLRNAQVNGNDNRAYVGLPLAKIGEPYGLPLKIATSRAWPSYGTGGVIHGQGQDDGLLIYHDLDAFGGDSGAGIYDLASFSYLATHARGPRLRGTAECPTADLNGGTPSPLPKECNGHLGEDVEFKRDFIPWVKVEKGKAVGPTTNKLLYTPLLSSDYDAAKASLIRDGFKGVKEMSVGTKGAGYSIDMLRIMMCGGRSPYTMPTQNVNGDTKDARDYWLFTPDPDASTCNPPCKVTFDPNYPFNIENTTICNDKTNDLSNGYKSFPAVQVDPGREVTLSGEIKDGNTDLAYVYNDRVNALGSDPKDGICFDGDYTDGFPTPDMAYALTPVSTPTVLYVDTFFTDPRTTVKAAWLDTIVALYRVDNAGTQSEKWSYEGCHDDHGCSYDDWKYQTQGIFPLQANVKYVVLVTGNHNATGPFRLHLQRLPLSPYNRQLLELDPSTWPYALDTAKGTTLLSAPGDSGFEAPKCQYPTVWPYTAPEYEYVMMSCPTLVKDVIASYTVSPNTDFDTVLAFAQGNQYAVGGGACNDDDPGLQHVHDGLGSPTLAQEYPWEPKLQSALIADVSSGSGVRVLVVDGYHFFSLGNFELNYTIPTDMAAPLSEKQVEVGW